MTKVIAAVAMSLLVTTFPNHAKAQTVYTIPQLRAELSGVLEVGVRVSGSVVQKFDSAATIQTSYQHSNSYTVTNATTQASSSNLSYTATQTPKPPPSAGGFLTGLVGAISSGSPAPLVPFFASALDYTIDPVSRDWKRVYTRSQGNSTSNSTSLTQAQSQADTFIQKVTAQLQSNQTYDINAGYLRTGIRIRNLGSLSITITNPRFAVFFGSGNSDYMGGLALAYQSDPAGGERLFIPAGGSIDLNWELGGQNFANLVRRYVSADRIGIVLQSVQYPTDSSAPPLYVEQEIEAKRLSGVTLHVRSDNYMIDQVVVPAAGVLGMTLRDLLDAAGLSASFADPVPTYIGLSLTGVDPDLNPAPVAVRVDMPGDSMLAWRRWVVLVRNQQNAVLTQFKSGDLLRRGFTVSIHQLKGGDVLGPQFRPVVSRLKRVRFTPNNRAVVSTVPLQQGDEVVFTKIRVDTLRSIGAEYRRRDVTNEYRQVCTPPAPTASQCGIASWSPYAQMGYVPSTFGYPVLPNVAPGTPPVILYEPIRAISQPANMVDLLRVQAAPGIDAEPILRSGYAYLLTSMLRPYRNAQGVKRQEAPDTLVLQTDDPFAALSNFDNLALTVAFDVTQAAVPSEWVVRTVPPSFLPFALQEQAPQTPGNVMLGRIMTLPLFPDDTSDAVVAPIMFRVQTPTLTLANTDATPFPSGAPGIGMQMTPPNIWQGQVNYSGMDPSSMRILLQQVPRARFPDLRLFPLSSLGQLGNTTGSATPIEPVFVLTSDVEVVRRVVLP